jgi:type IV pilus assembly protein PilB
MASLKDRIKEILIRDNLIEPAALEQALDEQRRTGKELSSILTQRKLIHEDVLTQVLSEGLELPPINISRLKIDPGVIHLIPSEMAQKYRVMPISLLGENLTLAMADPLNIFAIDNVKALTGLTITPIIGRVKDVEASIQKYYGNASPTSGRPENQETFEDIMKDIKDTEEPELVRDGAGTEKGAVEELTGEAPIIKLADTIIQQAVFARASDVFIEPLEKEMRVRYRVDGVIREIDRMSKVLHAPLISRIKVISNLDISEHRLPQDGRFKTIISGNKEVDFRVNVLPTITGEKIVLRVLDQNNSILDLEKLGFEPKSMERLKECADRPHGMILTCGPTGSGKTTTLYSVLKYVDSPESNIVTVEDPVEYQMKGLNQVNVKAAMGLTFSASLRSILRQDPDIIMIGEIRDAETLDIAVKAALTGHLVLSSLHTTTAAGSVIRMMNMGIEPFLICSSVLAIVAQRLLRRVCEHCKEKYVLLPGVAQKVGLKTLYPDHKEFQLYRGKGCQKCMKNGYKGRVGIHEILSFTQKIRDLVLSRAGEYKIKHGGREEGMHTMREDGLMKAMAGLTTLEEVLRVTANDEAVEEKE